MDQALGSTDEFDHDGPVDVDRRLEVDTPVGMARLTLHRPAGDSYGTLLLGHGAGGGIEAPDLVAVSAAAVANGWLVGLVEQPWRVAGKRVAAAPPRLDQAWLAVLEALASTQDQNQNQNQNQNQAQNQAQDRIRPLVVGGRSAGARVACRTAAATGADAVLCLAFPLHPPGRPERSRAAELAEGSDGGRPLYVVQGRRDGFGTPDDVRSAARSAGADVEVHAVDGDHALRADLAAVAAGTVEWLARVRATVAR